MSRGLSRQQLRILGLAYAFNCQLHGGEYVAPGIVAPAGDQYRDGYKHRLISESAAPPDFFPWMLEHYVAGIPFKKLLPLTSDRRNAFYRQTAAMKSAKASLRRAVSTLWDKGYLAEHTWKERFPGPSTLGNVIDYGYVLAPEHMELAKKNILDIGDAMATVCRMLEQTGIWGRNGGIWWQRPNNETKSERIRRLARGISVTRAPIGAKVTDTVNVTDRQICPEATHMETVTDDHAWAAVTINPDGSLEVGT